jgi:hypothetical protein
MNWREFKREAPPLARAAERLMKKTGVILLGTVRRDGSPRISPVEPFIVDGELMLGMMWRSLKALDLLRDPRCTVHNAVADRMARHGEFKLHGRARNVSNRRVRRHYCEVLRKKIGWAPDEPNYHLFAVDIRSAGLFANQKDARLVHRWRAGGRVVRYRQTMEEINPPETREGKRLNKTPPRRRRP